MLELIEGVLDELRKAWIARVDANPAMAEQLLLLHNNGLHLLSERLEWLRPHCALFAWSAANAMMGWSDVTIFCLRHVLDQTRP